jgi:hypothetical protein
MDDYQLTLGDLLRKIGAAIERMSVKNPNRVLLDQCAQIIVQQARLAQHAGPIRVPKQEHARVVLTDG